MTKRLLLATAALFALASCTSALKKKCQETNWFEHGFAVAMSGKRLNSDSFKDQCYKEGVDVSESEMDRGFKAGMANYCKPESAMATGKQGDPLNLDLCDAQSADILKKNHREGVEFFCRESGFAHGASGREYKQVCPTKLEAAFLKEFRRGRKSYLHNQILGREQEIAAEDVKARDLHARSRDINGQLRAVQARLAIASMRSYSSPEARQNATSHLENERQNKQWELDRTEREIAQTRKRQDELRAEISKLRTERDSLAD
jgi:hypothetical protein